MSNGILSGPWCHHHGYILVLFQKRPSAKAHVSILAFLGTLEALERRRKTPTAASCPELGRRAAPLIRKFLSVVFPLLILISNFGCSQGKQDPIGPGKGGMGNNFIIGQFVEWDRKATPTLVLRIHGASLLQTFADISADGAFKLPLPEVPAEGNFGSMNWGQMSVIFLILNGSVERAVAGNFSPMTERSGSLKRVAMLRREACAPGLECAPGRSSHGLQG